MKVRVELTGMAVMTTHVEVEVENEEEAGPKAVRQVRNTVLDVIWHYGGIEDETIDYVGATRVGE